MDPCKEGDVIRIGSIAPMYVRSLQCLYFIVYILQYRAFVSIFRWLFPDSEFSVVCFFSDASINTHSFCIGGASTAASVGIPDSAIQILGRWSSNAFRRYLQFPDDTIAEFSQRMASARALRKVWDSNWLISKDL